MWGFLFASKEKKNTKSKSTAECVIFSSLWYFSCFRRRLLSLHNSIANFSSTSQSRVEWRRATIDEIWQRRLQIYVERYFSLSLSLLFPAHSTWNIYRLIPAKFIQIAMCSTDNSHDAASQSTSKLQSGDFKTALVFNEKWIQLIFFLLILCFSRALISRNYYVGPTNTCALMLSVHTSPLCLCACEFNKKNFIKP